MEGRRKRGPGRVLSAAMWASLALTVLSAALAILADTGGYTGFFQGGFWLFGCFFVALFVLVRGQQRGLDEARPHRGTPSEAARRQMG
jgi:hypothetical protein